MCQRAEALVGAGQQLLLLHSLCHAARPLQVALPAGLIEWESTLQESTHAHMRTHTSEGRAAWRTGGLLLNM